MTIFEGSAVALILPMFDNGDIDFEGFKRQVQRMIDGGVQALLVNGTTGETATITIEDEFKLLDMTMELAKGTGVKVICGAGSNDTQTALKKARYAKEKGALIAEQKIQPKLIIGVPVGFVNVIEAKELILAGTTPYIVAKGNKGGSNVAAAICNALLYQLIQR